MLRGKRVISSLASQKPSREVFQMARVMIIFLLIASCAFVGPQITSEEEKRAQAVLMTEAQAWQKKQEQKRSLYIYKLDNRDWILDKVNSA